jgi:Phytanoyl-CoA dioxygenase (PhyH)
MHRKRTRFAARVSHLASAIEARGIRGTYELHDRVLSNRKSRRRFARTPPELDAVQSKIVAELDMQGYAELPFGELFPSGEEWAAVDAWAEAFVAATERDLAGEAGGTGEMTHRREGKEFVVRRYDRQASMDDDPWFGLCQSRRMLDVANAYLRMWSKLEYVDLWYTPPVAEAKERVASQHWHRDFQDRSLLKAFLYLVDVDEGAGPFEYVPGSTGDGPYASEWPWRPLGTTYPGDEELGERVPDAAIRTFTASRGTLIFCNTSGFHRGGFATERPRVLATATYLSPASLASLTERNYVADGREAPDPVVAFALS